MPIPHSELGYYTCNHKIFSSKIEACIYATKHKCPIKWIFNDAVFDSYPWHIEPEESLDELYDKRAREIREKYDYVVLAFSGGGDSNNVLESFLRQNLLIDEIVVNVMDDYNSTTVIDPNVLSNWNEGAEYTLQTLPRLRYVQSVSPRTKISVIDLSKQVFDFLSGFGDENWLSYTRERLNVSGLMRHNFLHFKEIRKQFDKSKSVAMVLGIEKPRTYIKGNMFKMMFSDKAVNIATVSEFIEDYTNTGIEYFYWHPSCAKMIAKQAHIIKRFVELTPKYRGAWQPDSLGDLFKKHRTVQERVLRPLLYSTWRNNYWQSDKSTLDWYSEIDNWFTEGHKNSKEFAIWQAGLKYVQENAKDFIVADDNNQIGLKGFMKAYDIGEVHYVDQPSIETLSLPILP
jgi:uncharacterized protein YutD